MKCPKCGIGVNTQYIFESQDCEHEHVLRVWIDLSCYACDWKDKKMSIINYKPELVMTPTS